MKDSDAFFSVVAVLQGRTCNLPGIFKLLARSHNMKFSVKSEEGIYFSLMEIQCNQAIRLPLIDSAMPTCPTQRLNHCD